MNRDRMLQAIRARVPADPWDIAIIGGGATGVGIAVDAASRGYSTVLLERADFSSGTSSRSTKLVHGGVRYLEQGNIPLVMGALKERGILRNNAPHLVHDLAFIVPTYDWWEGPFYGVGLRVYDLLAGKYGFGRSKNLSRDETLARIPTLKTEGLRGGVVYYDGQFDDARLNISLARTAAKHGAVLVNYCNVTSLTRDADDQISGLTARDVETGNDLRIPAKVVINATGPFADEVRRLADPGAPRMISPSQGVHIVLDRTFLPRGAEGGAIMVPHTKDGRVMFAIPWHNHTLVGTTDTPIPESVAEPRPQEQEIDFILETVAQYLSRPPTRADILSTWAGIRPLVGGGGGASASGEKRGGDGAGKTNTASLSRDHTIHIDDSGLLTITGGKWTTYRHMAEDAVDHAAELAGLDDRPCITRDLRIDGYMPEEEAEKLGHLSVHGANAAAIQAIAAEDPTLAEPLHPDLPYTGAEVVWAAREEMARTVDDVLARRTRASFLNSRAAERIRERVEVILHGCLMNSTTGPSSSRPTTA